MALQSLAVRSNSWAYQFQPGSRDLRLDLLRGFAIFAMVVDHFGGHSWLTYLTGGNEFLVSAAEGFVFLSGFVTGMVYGRRIQRDGWLAAAEAIIRRAALLYVVTVGLTLLFVGLFLFTDLRLWLDRVDGRGLTDPVELVGGIPGGPALALACLGLAGLILLDWAHDTGRIATWPLLSGLAGESYLRVFDKSSVAPGRVVAFAIAACFFFLFVSRLWRPIYRA